jgi:protein O-GlcNAc transferase
LERFNQALAINATIAETWNNRGTVFNELSRYREAIEDFDKAASIDPNYAGAYCNKGHALAKLKLYDQSLNAFDRAISLKPDFADAWLGRGYVFAVLCRHDDALTAYDKALTLKPDLAEAWLDRGKILAKLNQDNNALAAFDRALTLKPDLAEAWLGRGNVFFDFRRYDEAIAAYDKALALKPDLAGVWYRRGNIFFDFKRYDEAIAAYDKALALNNELTGAEGLRIHAKMNICNWDNHDTECTRLIRSVQNENANTSPFEILAITSSSSDLLQCSKSWIANVFPLSDKTIWQGKRYDHNRIRVAYLSADFRHHAVSFLMAGMLEQHDKSRFETTAISWGPDDNSEMRERIKQSCESFIDVRTQTDTQIAELVHAKEIDIAIDLMGFTNNMRTGIFARRPVPIQVNYLGYPGTMGADYFDYILADPTVIPEDQFEFYSEKVVWLPDSYQVNDSQRSISECTPTRSKCGLPETGFVYCCFNNTFKITPEIFYIWMRLLQTKADSVLWLLEGNSTAAANLRREAEKCGVSPQRLIFAPRMPLADHLARHRRADLFLDTLPYNAHTTASDALWAGLPVLTFLGSTFAGRVAASLLKAVGLTELITTSLDDYETMAIKIAHEPELLASLKDKLARNRDTYPLFNTKRFTRHIEAAYVAMWEKYQRWQPPTSFAVDAVE